MARTEYTPRHGAPRHASRTHTARALVRRPVVGSALAVGLLTTMGAAVATGEPSEADAAAATLASSSTRSTPAAEVAPVSAAADLDRLGVDRREINASRSAAREQERLDAKKRSAAKKKAAAKKKSDARAAERRKQAKKADWVKAVQKDPKPYAVEVMREAGFGDDQWGCLEALWIGESNFTWDATNPTSGAYGIPQSLPAEKMADAGPDWKTNPVTQMEWGINYIKEAYGSPCEAYGFWNMQDPHWY